MNRALPAMRGELAPANPGQDRKNLPGRQPRRSLRRRFRGTETWKEGKTPGPRRVGKHWDKSIAPVFGDVAPSRGVDGGLDQWLRRTSQEDRRALRSTPGGENLAALWRVAGTLKTATASATCNRTKTHSSALSGTKSPKAARCDSGTRGGGAPGQARVRMEYRGLASGLRGGVDTSLSPVDVRRLTSAQLMRDATGPLLLCGPQLRRQGGDRDTLKAHPTPSQGLSRHAAPNLFAELSPSSHAREPTGSEGRPAATAGALHEGYARRDVRVVREAEFSWRHSAS